MDLDPHVVDIVQYFNMQGLTTIMSCEGHNSTNMSMFWIQFSPSVTEDDIIDFQLRHTNPPYNTFTSCGRFAQRIYWGGRTREKSWQYMAATKEAAAKDLKKWERTG